MLGFKNLFCRHCRRDLLELQGQIDALQTQLKTEKKLHDEANRVHRGLAEENERLFAKAIDLQVEANVKDREIANLRNNMKMLRSLKLYKNLNGQLTEILRGEPNGQAEKT